MQHLTKQDLITLLEIINESLECNSEKDLRQLLLRLNKEEGGFAFHGLKRSPRAVESIRIIISHFHQALYRLRGKHKPSFHSHLTPKETEILKWVKQGKTTWDISTILGISSRTVKFHMKNIFRKLDVVTRAHAVAVALEQGLLDMD